MSQHAHLPPSSAHIWVKCALWVAMRDRYPEADREEAAEGEAAHWVNVQSEAPTIGTRAPNSVAVTAAMLEGRKLWLQATGAPVVGVAFDERALISLKTANRWGTPDRFTAAHTAVTVYDYKFGFEQKEAFENWQLIEYVRLIIETFGLSDLQVSVRMVIVQPRGYHRLGPVREWVLPQAALLRAYWNILDAAERRALEPEKRGTVGLHCRNCPGRHACDALQRNTWSAIDYSGSSLPLELTPQAIGNELREVKRAQALLKARETGLEAQAAGLMMSGQRVPHFSMGSTKPRPVWKLAPEQLAPLGAAFNVQLTKQEPITPNQAIQAGMPAEVVQALIDYPKSELKVIEDDGSFTRKVFGNGNAAK